MEWRYEMPEPNLKFLQIENSGQKINYNVCSGNEKLGVLTLFKSSIKWKVIGVEIPWEEENEFTDLSKKLNE